MFTTWTVLHTFPNLVLDYVHRMNCVTHFPQWRSRLCSSQELCYTLSPMAFYTMVTTGSEWHVPPNKETPVLQRGCGVAFSTIFTTGTELPSRAVCISDDVQGRHVCQNRPFPETTGEDNLTVFSYSGTESEVPWMEAAAEKSWSVIVLDLEAWTYYNIY